MTFLDLEKTPLPPPAFGCAFIADLTPESIAKAEREAMADLKRNQQQSATVFDYQTFAQDTRIKAKNSVLKQEKMVSVYQGNNTKDTKKESRNKQFRLSHKSLPFIKNNSLTEHK